MDHNEARAILTAKLDGYRRVPYLNLVSRVGSEVREESIGASGTTYYIELTFCWDDVLSKRDIRVLGSIDDGGWRACWPLCDSFIMGPRGEFVGE